MVVFGLSDWEEKKVPIFLLYVTMAFTRMPQTASFLCQHWQDNKAFFVCPSNCPWTTKEWKGRINIGSLSQNLNLNTSCIHIGASRITENAESDTTWVGSIWCLRWSKYVKSWHLSKTFKLIGAFASLQSAFEFDTLGAYFWNFRKRLFRIFPPPE